MITLTIVTLAFLGGALFVLAIVNGDRAAAHRRLRQLSQEAAEAKARFMAEIAELKAQLDKPRAPAQWTRTGAQQ